MTGTFGNVMYKNLSKSVIDLS